MKRRFSIAHLDCRLWFAGIGAAIALIAAFLLEPLFLLGHVEPALQDLRQELPAIFVRPPARVVSHGATSSAPEVAERLRRAGAHSGDIQVSLSWNNVNDLDLHCIDPYGAHLFYSMKNVPSGGNLDVDQNSGQQRTSEPVENLFWPLGIAPNGDYRIFVQYYGNHGGHDPTPYRVEVNVKGVRRVFTGKLMPHELRDVTTFHLDPGSVQFQGDRTPTPADWTSAPPMPSRSFHRDGLLRAFVVTGAWAAVLGLLLPLAFRLGLIWWFREPIFATFRKGPLLSLAGRGLGFGLLSGLLGQAFFSLAITGLAPEIPVYGLAWAVLGFCLGATCAALTPYLPRRAGRLAGLVGAAFASLLFLFMASGDAGDVGRVFGAALIGAFIGFMIAVPRPPLPEPEEEEREAFPTMRPMTISPLRGAHAGSLEPPIKRKPKPEEPEPEETPRKPKRRKKEPAESTKD